MTMRIEAIAVILTAAVLTIAAQETKRGLSAEVIAEKQSVRLGDPILVSVRVTNRGPEAAEASRSATAFDCFEVVDPDGKRLPYVGFDGQVMQDRINVPPLSAVSIAEALDLSDKYLFLKPGRYSVRFSGKSTGLSSSTGIEIEVTPGRLSDFDEIAVSLLPVCPDQWRLVKDDRGQVTPFGRSRVPGFTLHLCHNHMAGEAVLLWVTKAEAKAEPNQQPRGKAEYLGRVRGLFVYRSIGSNTSALWPTAAEDVARALQIAKP